MKSLGTITACFPHVDDETQSILQSVMDEAKDYGDFAKRLCDRACKNSVPSLLNYFAYLHAFNQANFILVRNLIDAHTVSDLVEPIVLMIEPPGMIDWSDFQKSVAKALKAALSDWIACHMYVTWRVFVEPLNYYPERFTDVETLQILESKILNDESFSFFAASLHRNKAFEYQREGNREEAKKWFNRSLAMAKKHDQQELVVNLLFYKANLIKIENFDEALSILKIHKDLSMQLGLDIGLASNTAEMGFRAQMRGEYELALEHLTEFKETLESLGHRATFQKVVLALQHNQMMDGANALDFANDALQDSISESPCFAYIQKAWALAVLDQVEEASQILDMAREPASKRGFEYLLGYIHFIEGLIHKQRSEFASATFALEQAHSVFEREESLHYTNLTLLQFTQLEIETFSYGKAKSGDDVSGPWMQKLMKHTNKNNLPGIDAQAMLLKARFRFKQGRINEAKKIFKKVLKISDSSNMKYLRNVAEHIIPDLLVS